MSYLNGKVPEDYCCGECLATNCKLWREYSTTCPNLKCVLCLAKARGFDPLTVDRFGLRPSPSGVGMTDQISWYVPAVPDESGVGYWGYTAVADTAAQWWRDLPTFPVITKHHLQQGRKEQDHGTEAGTAGTRDPFADR